MSFHTAPNWLTLSRVLLGPLLVAALFQQTPFGDAVAVVIFVIAAVTDFFDGYLARMQKSVSVIGKLMDPLADKILVVASIVMLQHLGRIGPVVVMLLISREIAITGLRAMASAEGIVLAASRSAKWKTGLQMTALPLLMLPDGLFGMPTLELGVWLLYASLLISLWSGKDYFVEFFAGLKKR